MTVIIEAVNTLKTILKVILSLAIRLEVTLLYPKKNKVIPIKPSSEEECNVERENSDNWDDDWIEIKNDYDIQVGFLLQIAIANILEMLWSL